MEALLIIFAVTFGLLWVVFILPQQRRVRAHQRLILSLQEGDEVVLTAGIFGRITRLGPEVVRVEVAPGTELKVARQAVLRRVEDATRSEVDKTGDDGNNAELSGDGNASGSPSDG
jgi:preprotein translocase subunit YajC